MPDSASLTRAIHNVLVRSLGLRRDQSLLIFADANSLEAAEAILRYSRELGISASILYVPRFQQADLGHAESLPLLAEAAIREADAILSCLSDSPEHRNYRLRILHTSWGRRTKLAHTPGMTLNVLRMADTDYDAIGEQAALLAVTLILGKRIDLVTTDSRNQEYRLTMDIGGWNYPPGISDGVISDGAWGNLPPGEVYIVPHDGNGQIAINGSWPGKVLGQGEELILTFLSGRLVSIEPDGSPAARHLYDTQIAYAEQQGDPNWSNLAEVGFGLNPDIHDLCGIELVDEKKAHTVHIALGHSASLGGDVDSVIHCDLIVKRPTVYINGRMIMKRGDLRVNESDWRLDHRTVTIAEEWWSRLVQVRRSGIRTEREGGRLLCLWNAGRGRWDSTPVGNDSTARLAARLYDLIPAGGAAIGKERLLAEAIQAGIPDNATPGVLWVMHLFDLVRSPGESGI